MENIGINIRINGEQITRAGFNKAHYVLHAMAAFARRRGRNDAFGFHVGGLDSDANINVDWLNTALKLGDIVTLEIVKGPFAPSEPHLPPVVSEEDQLKYELELFYRLKEELKDHINE
ncbi:hypothetical protein I6I98_12980 [Sphingobacterium multivorum]|uniref:Uncharacterized protein n=1 Tax=Sphingobacterium multivorum TaxID=28454 RepID=A0ABX7CVK8_SPHMU|nr:hypothetical protein [Sphingobacterium multivorum]QQT56116.1 hypothetical protein I6I98_12980 [Sphingobacterium multivorum]